MTRVTLIAPALLILYGCVMPVLLIRFYVVPYQTGAGRLLVDGSIDWWAGETLLALASAVLYIPLGVISAAVIWRRYKPL
jgi:sodium/pantothenate symporter